MGIDTCAEAGVFPFHEVPICIQVLYQDLRGVIRGTFIFYWVLCFGLILFRDNDDPQSFLSD